MPLARAASNGAVGLVLQDDAARGEVVADAAGLGKVLGPGIDWVFASVPFGWHNQLTLQNLYRTSELISDSLAV